jgi:F0F1-type ATP synthase assembly protein I
VKDEEKKRMLRDYGFYVDLVLRFAITIVLFVFLGLKLDDYLNTKPLLIMVFTFVGAAGAFFILYRALIRYEKKEKNDS